MNHHTVTNINADVRYRAAAVICPCEENNITGLCVRRSDRSTQVENTLRRCSAERIYAGVFEYPAHKSRTVKRGLRTAAAPNIRIAQILLGFGYQLSECFVRKSLARNCVVIVWALRYV